MSSELPTNFCPYKGLQPYTEADRAYFFGRERDQEIIASNLYAASLTILYGASGVGKSSVLLAGVVPQLRREPRLAVVVFRQWQDAGFATMLKREILRAVTEKTGKAVDVDLALPLDEFLLRCGKHLRGPIFLFFDQFEEFCLYHPPTQSDEGFDAEFARAVNRQEVDANFLLSLRDDGLSKLDRFRGRIPRLLGNMLRLEHLDMEAGREAVLKPLDSYNRNLKEGQPQVSIEDSLVESLLEQVKTGKVTIAQSGHGQGGSARLPDHLGEDSRIETPFLQMVLMRLWNEEMAAGSHLLRLETLQRLGGAQSIVRTHLDTVMNKLPESERDIAARLFRYLVTPSGMKIAHTPADLASYVELPDADASRVLMLLGSPEVRILRSVSPPPDQPDNLRYEIFHDVLGASILDWRRRYTEQQTQERIKREEQERLKKEQAEAERQRERMESLRLRKQVSGLSLLLIIAIAATGVAIYQWRAARRANKESRSRAIAAHAFAHVASDPDLSLLLAIEAVKESPTNEARQALKAALLQTHTELVLPHNGEVRNAVFNHDGTLIATAALSEPVKVWDAKTGALVKELQPQDDPGKYSKGARKVSFSPDGKYLVAANLEGSTARVWEVSNWQPLPLLKVTPLRKLAEKDQRVYSAAFSPDSSYLITTSDDPSPQVWKVETWEQEAVLQGVKTAPPPQGGAQPPPQEGTQQPPGTPPSSPPAGDARPMELKGHTGAVFDVNFSPDGKHIITTGQSSVVLVWQVGGTWKPELRLNGHTASVYGAGVSQDSKLVVTASGDRTARVWYLETGKEQEHFLNHPHIVYDAAFSPVKDDIATACWDYNARIWRQTPDKVWTVLSEFRGHKNWIYSVAFSPKGDFMVTGGADKSARVWRTTDPTDLPDSIDDLLELARKRPQTRQPLTPQEQQKFLGN